MTAWTRIAWTVCKRDLVRYGRSPARILGGLVQPLLFLFILGYGLSPLVGQSGGLDFRKFVFPGVLVMGVSTAALFNAAGIVWDREYGFLRQVLAAPVPRSSVVAGKAAGGTCVAMIQGAVLLALAPTAGMTLTVPLAAGLLGICLVTALALALFGIALAGLVRRVESFQVLVQFLLFPLIFLSGALFPLQGLPGWLAAITKLNPLTYAIDPLRQLVFESQGVPAAARERFAGVQFGDWRMGLVLELAVLVGFGLLCLLVASRGLSRRERP